MITFDKASNVVKLTNGKIDYAVYINTEGYLETVYFGKAIRNFDPTTMRTAPKGHAETHVYDPAIGSERWFADGFKQNVLGSIFSGNCSKQIDIELVSKLPSFEDGYTFTFDYKADMVLKKDGKDFVYGTNTDKQIKFQQVFFKIPDTNGYNQIYLYAKEVVGSNTYYYEIATVANTSALYDYVSELTFA